MWKKLNDWLALTSTERKILFFLSAAFFIGVGIRLFREAYPTPTAFDYREADSTFATLSDALASAPEVSEEHTEGKINLNTASKRQLMALPGIGEVMAERIILSRTDDGPFTTVEELQRIKGISRKRLEQLRDLITVDPPPLSPREE